MATKTESNLTELKINKLTKAQYEEALAKNEINENEIYAYPEEIDTKLDSSSTNSVTNMAITAEINNVKNNYGREITINIGNTSILTAALLNTYLKATEYPLGGFTIVNVNGTYNNVCTLLVNAVAGRNARAMYGYAIGFSYYSSMQYFKLDNGTWK